MLALSCGVLVLYLVVIILAIIGFWGVYRGKMEYGSAHEKDIGRAMMLFIMAIVFFFVNAAMSIAAQFASMDFANPTDVSYAPSPALVAVSAVFGTLFAAAVAILPHYIVKSFTPPEKQSLGIMAIGFYVLSPVLAYVLSLVFSPSSDFSVLPARCLSIPHGSSPPSWPAFSRSSRL